MRTNASVGYHLNSSPQLLFFFLGRQQVLGPTINACATLSLRALNSGDTTVNVTFGKHSAVAYISAFNKLKVVYHSGLIVCSLLFSFIFDQFPASYCQKN